MTPKVGITEDRRLEIEDLLSNEIKFGIVSVIIWMGSSNLKKIAQFIDKPESTTIRHIKQLLEEGILDLDSEKTKKDWGTFYTLSQDMNEVIRLNNQENEKRQESVIKAFSEFQKMSEEELNKQFTELLFARKDIPKLTRDLKQSLSFIHTLQNVITNLFERQVISLIEIIDEKGLDEVKKNIIISPTDISLFSHNLTIAKPHHLIRYYDIILRYDNEMQKLKAELEKEMKDEKIPEEERFQQHFHLFTGSTNFRYRFKN